MTKALMPGLRDNTSLTDLNLDYVRLHNEGAIEVAQVLEINTTLRVLSIRYNMINGEGVRSIVASTSAIGRGKAWSYLELMSGRGGAHEWERRSS